MLAMTPALPNPGDSSDALGLHDFPLAVGSSFRLQADLRVGSLCFANGDTDAVTVAGLIFPADRYGIAIAVSSGEASLLEVTYAGDGGVSNVQNHTFSIPVPLDQWETVTLDARLGVTKTVSVTVGATQDLRNEKMSLAPIAPQHPTLAIGATVKNDHKVSTGCKVLVDNVLFDLGLGQ
jgi:hypothetical protein